MSDIGQGGVRGTPETEHESGYIRVPLPVAALGVVVVLAALLGVGLYANANLRAAGVTVPTPATAASTQPPATLAAAAAPTSQPATPTPAPAAPTATSLPALTAAATVGTTPQVVVTVESATPTLAQPAATESPTPLPTVEPTLAAEVGQAYENFWQVTSEALLNLDTTQLPEVMDDDYLSTVTNRIAALRSENRAIKTQVVLNYSVVQADSQVATVVDDFEDNSVYVTAGTEEPLSEPVSDRERTLYTLHHNAGAWKVVDGVRSQ